MHLDKMLKTFFVNIQVFIRFQGILAAKEITIQKRQDI